MRGLRGVGIQGLASPVFSAGCHEIQYILRDDFTTDLAAGSVNGTSATPGPGTRGIIDTGSKMSIAGGLLTSTGVTGDGDPGCIYTESFSRTPGLMLIMQVNNAAASQFDGGWYRVAAPNLTNASHAILHTGTTLEYANIAGAYGPNVPLFSIAGTSAAMAIVLRATGAFYLARLNDKYLLYSPSNYGAYPTVYAGVIALTGAMTPIDTIRIPDCLWLPSPVVSDGFSRASISDGLGHAEGLVGGIGSGGWDVAWTDNIGTWSVGAGVLSASALIGGVAIRTTSTKNDVVACVDFTRSGGVGGLVMRYIDSDNYIYIYHDGTNLKLIERVAGVETQLRTIAATYSAGKRIVCRLEGGTLMAWYGDRSAPGFNYNALVQATGTVHGVYTTDTGNTFDNYRSWATGTEGEYNF